MLTITPGIKIIATILAKNEEDIIAQTIEHHLSHGVSEIIFTNNNSTDRTKQIAERYPEVIEIIDEPDDTHNQSRSVTRMARLACKLNPDWIVHLDADELWCGLTTLREHHECVVSCQKLYLHPPVSKDFSIENMRFYLDFDHLPISQEAKIAHRPDPDIEITHGNHAVAGKPSGMARSVSRHHYPIRSLRQWASKSQGHLNLAKRNAICERWENWHNALTNGQLEGDYSVVTNLWDSYCKKQEKETFLSLAKFWATSEMIAFFQSNDVLPKVREWPRF